MAKRDRETRKKEKKIDLFYIILYFPTLIFVVLRRILRFIVN